MGKKDYLFAGALAVIFSIFYGAMQPFGDFLVVSTDLLFACVSGVCSALALMVVLKLGYRGKLGLVHLGVFCAIFLWFLGETTWMIYEVYFKIPVPYPSVADIFYVAGYVPAAFALVQFLWVFRKMFTTYTYTITFLVGLVITGTAYVFLLGPLLTSNAWALGKVFDVLYPVLDVVLLVLAIVMFLVFQQSSISVPWLWIAFGMFLTAMADIAFSFGTLQRWYYSGHPIELFWLWGYLSIGLGLKVQLKAETEITPT